MMIQSSNSKLNFANNRVEHTHDENIGALNLALNNSATLTNSAFINCKVSDYQTIHILAYATFTPTFTMVDCEFNNCVTDNYISFLQNKGDVTIRDCSFIFSNNENACEGVDIDSLNEVTISIAYLKTTKIRTKKELAVYIFIEKQLVFVA